MQTVFDPRQVFAGNVRALELLNEVEGFFAGRVVFERLPAGETVSEYSLDPGVLPMAPVVRLATSDREPESLAHELLHLALRARGYPQPVSFNLERLSEVDRTIARTEMQGFQNALDHETFLSMYLSLGFAKPKFLSGEGHDVDEKNFRWAAELPSGAQSTKRLVFFSGYFRVTSAALGGNTAAERLVPVIRELAANIEGFHEMDVALGAWRQQGAYRAAATAVAATNDLIRILGLPPIVDFAFLRPS